MIQGKIDFNSPGPSTVWYQEYAISPRLSSFYFHILIVLTLTIKCEVLKTRFYGA